MYNLTSKLLSILLDPLLISFALLLAAWFFHRRRLFVFKELFALRLLVLCVFACPLVSEMLIGSLENQNPDRGLAAISPAQAIVVLGGSLEEPGPQHQASALLDSSDRLLTGFRLYRATKAPILVMSGGNNPAFRKTGTGSSLQAPEADSMRALLEEWGVPEAATLVEEKSINTHENAINTHQLLAAQGITRIILVTSAFHLPRAAAAFRKAGFDVDPAPANFRNRWFDSDMVPRWVPQARALEDSSLAIYEWVGLLVYRLRGWA